MSKYKFYYSIVDQFPPYRVDIVELFDMLCHSNDIDIEWYMDSGKPNKKLSIVSKKQNVNLPIKLAGNNPILKLVNKIFYWLFDIICLLKCFFKPVDLIQVRDKYIGAIIGLLIAKVKGKSFIYWCSYPFPEHDFDAFLTDKSIKRYFYWMRSVFGHFVIYSVVMPYGTHTFVQTKQMLEDISALGVNRNKMTPVPMGVPKRLIGWKANGQLIPIVAGRIVYLGTLAAVRRLEVLIDAFLLLHNTHPSATLLIVGDGNFPHERMALEAYVAKLGLSDSVEFTGFVPIEQAWTLTASGAVCVSPIYPTPILNCGSPTKLVEYMALGRPVICNENPEQSDIISGSGAGLCVPWGAQEFADAMVWMLEHPSEAEAMGAKGPSWIEANRTYSIIANDVMQKYREILSLCS